MDAKLTKNGSIDTDTNATKIFITGLTDFYKSYTITTQGL